MSIHAHAHPVSSFFWHPLEREGYLLHSLLLISSKCSLEGLGKIGSKKSTHSLTNADLSSDKS